MSPSPSLRCKMHLKLPSTALRYKPPMAAEEVLAVYKQYGIDAGGENPPRMSLLLQSMGHKLVQHRRICPGHPRQTRR
jgi:hypothetical protein